MCRNDLKTTKRFKPFLALRPLITRLKPGANETENFRCKKLSCAPDDGYCFFIR